MIYVVALVAAEPIVEPLAQGVFRMRVESPPATFAEAQAQLRPAAARACAGKQPTFGRFRYGEATASEPIALEQELLCLPPSAVPVPAAARLASDWAPDSSHQARVLAASYAYFAAKDAARYAEAYRQLSPRQQADRSLIEWTFAATAFNAEAGAVRARRVVEISWYNHPADAPEPGIYVAADYSAEFEKLEFVCGYLMWRLQPDGGFRLVREEQNLVHKRGRAMPAIDRDPLRARMGCKD